MLRSDSKAGLGSGAVLAAGALPYLVGLVQGFNEQP